MKTIKDEQDFCTELQKWLKHNWTHSGPIECKFVRTPSFSLRYGFKPHQLPNLINSGTNGDCAITYKISDLDRMEKPWDIDCYYKSMSYVAIMWKRTKNRTFYLVSPNFFVDCINVGIKGVKEADVRANSFVAGELK